jgi:hypothetical protein
MGARNSSNWLGYLVIGGAMLYFYFHSPSLGGHALQRQTTQTPKTGNSFQGVLQFQVSPLSGYEDQRPLVVVKTGQLTLRRANTLQLSLQVPCKFKVPDTDRINVTAHWSVSETGSGARIFKLQPPLHPAQEPKASTPQISNSPPIPIVSLAAAGFEANPLVQQDREWSWSLRPKHPGREELALTVSYPAGYSFGGPWFSSPFSITQKCADAAHEPEYIASSGKTQLVLATQVVDEFGLTPKQTTLLRIVGTAFGGVVGWLLQQIFKLFFPGKQV